jgi:hypothetical protein
MVTGYEPNSSCGRYGRGAKSRRNKVIPLDACIRERPVCILARHRLSWPRFIMICLATCSWIIGIASEITPRHIRCKNFHIENGGITRQFLTSAQDAVDWSDSRPGRFAPEETTLDTFWIGGWVDLGEGLDAWSREKSLVLAGNWTPAVQIVTILTELSRLLPSISIPNYSSSSSSSFSLRILMIWAAGSAVK